MLKTLAQSLFRLVTVVFCATWLMVPGALAIGGPLGEAQEQGLIGERADGYLGFVAEDGVDDALKRQVAEVNALRREVYTRKARQTGESLSVIAALAAEIQYARLEPGLYFMTITGEWVQKPAEQ